MSFNERGAPLKVVIQRCLKGKCRSRVTQKRLIIAFFKFEGVNLKLTCINANNPKIGVTIPKYRLRIFLRSQISQQLRQPQTPIK